MNNSSAKYWNPCSECKGQGRKSRRLTKKVKLAYLKECLEFEKSKATKKPIPPKATLELCKHCSGTGIIQSENPTVFDSENLPHIAIIGAGIGGVALALACIHRGIPFTLFERDKDFSARSQGYGLTLQQASKAIRDFGILELKEGIVSTRHVVHSTDGKIIAEWGLRKWLKTNEKSTPKRTNVHIARQSLRKEFLEKVEKSHEIKWNHQLIDFSQTNNKVQLNFLVNGEKITKKADLVVGADGIRSTVRRLILDEEKTPLRYLDCIVILGICPLNKLNNVKSPLLDSATVFQTANGNERIYIMPFSKDSVMWQLSFPLSEIDAKNLSEKGPKFLKEEACRRTQWHSPIPEILENTDENQISGYPVYDRETLNSESFQNAGNITLIGDAAHPMSPFKGQGANQALLDALELSRKITKECRPLSNWKEKGIRKSVLEEFEDSMLKRSEIKVKDSAEAAKFLHSEIVLHPADEPRGRYLKNHLK